jgi:hypothetical protein
MEHQLDATITVLLIFKISSTCFRQAFAHLQERKTEMFFTTYGIMSCKDGKYKYLCRSYVVSCTISRYHELMAVYC